MIWHDDCFVNSDIGEMPMDVDQTFQRDSAESIELIRSAKDTFFVVCADGSEIIVWSGVIINSQTRMLSVGKAIEIIVIH